jgi:hypothetical protein
MWLGQEPQELLNRGLVRWAIPGETSSGPWALFYFRQEFAWELFYARGPKNVFLLARVNIYVL